MGELNTEQFYHWSQVISFPWEWVEVEHSPVDRIPGIDYIIIKVGYRGVVYYLGSNSYTSLDLLAEINEDAVVSVSRFEPIRHVFNIRYIVSDQVDKEVVSGMEECIRLLEKYSMELLL